MPLWLMGLIVSLSLGTAFGCPKCQNINKPNTDKILKLIRETPIRKVTPNGDTTYVMLIRNAHSYYQQVYEDVVRCSGLRDDSLYAVIEFYVTDNTPIKMPDGELADCYYTYGSGTIVCDLLAVWEPRAIGHELLHALLIDYKLQSPDDTSEEDKHPDKWFGNHDGKCRGIVRPH